MNEMNNMNEIVSGFKQAMEFYRELGFEYLPVKKVDFSSDILSAQSVRSHEVKTHVVEAGEQSNGQALKLLRDEIGDCQRCKLSKGRNTIVFGEGNPHAELMFIGEGPGRDEDMQARPFVGDAGKLLTNLIVKLGLKREDVYIANIVKCRPPYNRNPEDDEILTCRPFLEKQIDSIKPRVIVCLGRIAAHALLGVTTPISKLRGSFFRYKEFEVMPTFHPAYLLRNPKDKWLTWDDMQKVLEKLNS